MSRFASFKCHFKMKWLVLFFTTLVADALKIENVIFEEYAMYGATVTMVCEYKVGESEYVDSIKWYKDNREFYRIVPHTSIEKDKVVTFNRSGINLDLQRSGLLKVGHHRLVLRDVDLKSTGTYTCQITLSGPPFHTEQRDKNLTVIIRPESRPEIIGVRPEYTLDKAIDVLCTSKRSYPASQLDFFINDEPVGEKMLTRYPTKKHSDGMETASIGLTYPLSLRNGFRLAAAKSDKLQLKCTAKIGSIYWESVVVETILRRDGYMLESRSSGASVRQGFQDCVCLLLLTMVLSSHMIMQN